MSRKTMPTTARRIDLGITYADEDGSTERTVLIELPLTAEDAGSRNTDEFASLPEDDRVLRAAVLIDHDGNRIDETEPFPVKHEGRTYLSLSRAVREWFERMGNRDPLSAASLLTIRAEEVATGTQEDTNQ